jgi:hypothetical protein
MESCVVTVPQFRPAIARGTDKDSVRLAIGRAAQRTGVDFTYLLNQAKSESGLDPTAKAQTSSAAGLYQFIDQSWLGVLKQHGGKHGYGWAADAIRWNGRGWSCDPAARQSVFALRKDPDCSALMAGEFASDNADGLRAALGREPTAGDLYFAHFLGLAGASKFLRAADANPDASAAALFPREAAVNRSIFYTRSGEARSLAQVYTLMARKVGGPAELPPGERAPTLPFQMASVMGDLRMTATALSETPPDDKGTADTPAATPEVLMARNDVNILRPSPQHAMLAYLMVLNPLERDEA